LLFLFSCEIKGQTNLFLYVEVVMKNLFFIFILCVVGCDIDHIEHPYSGDNFYPGHGHGYGHESGLSYNWNNCNSLHPYNFNASWCVEDWNTLYCSWSTEVYCDEVWSMRIDECYWVFEYFDCLPSP
jgi:hypothetical protein